MRAEEDDMIGSKQEQKRLRSRSFMIRLCACFSSLCVRCGSFKALQPARMPASTPGPETRSLAPAPHAKTRSR
ncbi:unnamed protein product [Sphagnum troendelagicum]|uniref:Uncharacterized protein n=1 Tax=Sphagnum troendelagicum TaxID=128251 RepID=A0ABP0TXY0_9BRYO